MAEKYQRSVIIQQPTGSTGNAEALGALADALGGVNKFFFDKASEARAKEGRRAAEQASLATGGKPELLEDPKSIYEKSYQEAATNAYGQSLKIDIDANLSRYAQEAGTDLVEFDQVAGKYQEGVLKNTPIALKESTRQYLAGQRAVLREQIGKAAVEAEREENRATLNATLKILDGKITRYSFDGNFELAEQERQARDAALAAAVDTGVISQAEMIQYRDKSDEAQETQIFLGGVDGAYDQGRAAEYIITFNQEPPPGMGPERRDEITNAMLQRLAFLNEAADGSFQAEEDGRLAMWRESDRRGTELLMSGELSYEWIQSRLAAGAIDPADARLLETRMLERRNGIPESDPAVLTQMELTLSLRSEADIVDEPGLSWDDKRRLLVERQERIENGPSFYTSDTYSDQVGRIEATYGLKSGMFMASQKTDALRDASAAVSQFTDELTEIAEAKGYVPASTIRDLAEKYITRATNQQQLDDIAGSRSTLQMKLEKEDIDRVEYEAAIERLNERERQIRESME